MSIGIPVSFTVLDIYLYMFVHHIDYVNSYRKYYNTDDYANSEPNQIIVDYMASMTDDYFVDLYAHLFPDSDKKIMYKGYFG